MKDYHGSGKYYGPHPRGLGAFGIKECPGLQRGAEGPGAGEVPVGASTGGHAGHLHGGDRPGGSVGTMFGRRRKCSRV